MTIATITVARSKNDMILDKSYSNCDCIGDNVGDNVGD